MHKRKIREHLKKVIDDWMDSVENPNIKALIQRHSILTGGSITSLLLNEDPHDYDIYFDCEEALVQIIQYYYPSAEFRNGRLFVADGAVKIVPDKKKTHQTRFVTSNSISLTNKIQIITRFWGELQEIHANFDFVHCSNFFYHGELFLISKALESTLAKRLYYHGSKYPVCSILRVRKFLGRGWNISAGQLFKIMFQISQLDLADPKVLEDQLIGVDTAFFTAFIAELKKNPPESIDETYIAYMMDELFDN